MAARITRNPASGERRFHLRGSLVLKSSAALAVAAALLAGCAPRAAPGATAQTGAGPGGPFHLVDVDGRAVDQSILSGKWSLVFFGYTFCPDVCPTTLTTLGQAMKQLGPEAKAVQVVFITVDPARDTPKALKTYLASPAFPRNTVGLTGTPQEIAKVAKEYVVYYQKEGSGPNYTMDHSTAIYLMDPRGRFHSVIADGLSPQQDAQQISAALSGA